MCFICSKLNCGHVKAIDGMNWRNSKFSTEQIDVRENQIETEWNERAKFSTTKEKKKRKSNKFSRKKNYTDEIKPFAKYKHVL